jgi:LysR family transcriptional regulator, hydrogen peroxide-inducible genes activator
MIPIGQVYGAFGVNLRDLKYLVALADTGHFGKAAERCFVSQPTLSAQIKKLEEYLGVKLLERQPKKVQLTDVGKQVVDRARRILHDGDEIVTLARHNKDPLAGKLRLGLIPTIGPYLLPKLTQRIRKALPRLSMMLYEYQTEPLLEHLRAGDVDLAILALPVNCEGLDVRQLYEEPFVVAVPDGDPLSAKASLKVQDLAGHTLLLLEDGHCLREQALEVCGRIDVKEADDFRATSLETLRQMVAAGLGSTLLPQMAADSPFGSQRGITIRPFSKPVPTRSIGAVWRKSSTRREAIDSVCDVIGRVMHA